MSGPCHVRGVERNYGGDLLRHHPEVPHEEQVTFRGPNLANLTEVESNDDFTSPADPLWSRLEFGAQANVTYRIVVGGYGATSPIDGDERRGAYKLSVTVLPDT